MREEDASLGRYTLIAATRSGRALGPLPLPAAWKIGSLQIDIDFEESRFLLIRRTESHCDTSSLQSERNPAGWAARADRMFLSNSPVLETFGKVSRFPLLRLPGRA
jgi:hypothetical protein